jgi:hypothetical protein
MPALILPSPATWRWSWPGRVPSLSPRRPGRRESPSLVLTVAWARPTSLRASGKRSRQPSGRSCRDSGERTGCCEWSVSSPLEWLVWPPRRVPWLNDRRVHRRVEGRPSDPALVSASRGVRSGVLGVADPAHPSVGASTGARNAGRGHRRDPHPLRGRGKLTSEATHLALPLQFGRGLALELRPDPVT